MHIALRCSSVVYGVQRLPCVCGLGAGESCVVRVLLAPLGRVCKTDEQQTAGRMARMLGGCVCFGGE